MFSKVSKINYRRAVWMAVLLYVTTFIIGGFSAAILGIDFSASPDQIPTLMWVVGLIEICVLMALFTHWFVHDVKKPAHLLGFEFGVIAIIIGFVLDMLVIVPSIVQSGAQVDTLSYYMSPWFWATMGAMLLTATLVGATEARK